MPLGGWAAYQFDVAVLTIGRRIDHEIAGGKSLEEAVFDRPATIAERLRRGEFRSVRAWLQQHSKNRRSG